MGVMYILDEPSIGLHPRDNDKLIKTLIHLKNLGNTVIVVEHDSETMQAADWIVDLGPGAGVHGGKIAYQGTYKNILKDKSSITGNYLSKNKNTNEKFILPSDLIVKKVNKENGEFSDGQNSIIDYFTKEQLEILDNINRVEKIGGIN